MGDCGPIFGLHGVVQKIVSQSISFSLRWTPVIPGTLTVKIVKPKFCDGNMVLSLREVEVVQQVADDGKGGLGSGSVNYRTGVGTVKFDSIPQTGNVVIADYSYDERPT